MVINLWIVITKKNNNDVDDLMYLNIKLNWPAPAKPADIIELLGDLMYTFKLNNNENMLLIDYYENDFSQKLNLLALKTEY